MTVMNNNKKKNNDNDNNTNIMKNHNNNNSINNNNKFVFKFFFSIQFFTQSNTIFFYFQVMSLNILPKVFKFFFFKISDVPCAAGQAEPSGADLSAEGIASEIGQPVCCKCLCLFGC